MAEGDPATRFAVFRSRLPELRRLILANGGKLPETVQAFAFYDLTAYTIEAPTNHMGGDERLYSKIKALLDDVSARVASMREIATHLQRWPEVGDDLLSGEVAMADPEWRALLAIEQTLLEHIEAFRPRRSIGRPEARSFIEACCDAARMVERETGIPVLRGERINPAMIDIVTVVLRSAPVEARLKPTLIDGIDRLEEPERKGVQAALRKGRQQGLLS